MKKIFFVLLVAVSLTQLAHAQIYMTRTGYIGFFSKTPMEDIKAENSQVYAVIDVAKKNLAFAALLKGFLFRKQLMQEHFNENYVESDKYPKATFTGTFTSKDDVTQAGVHTVDVSGTISLHGVEKPVTTTATLEMKDGKLIGKTHLLMVPGDYNIQIPSLVREKIEKEIKVDILIECTPNK
jgi:polyisoprenoid-binding protein YceI